MRRMVLGAAALFVCACGQQTQTASAPRADACARSATHDVVWTNSDAPDTIAVRAQGPTCVQAVVTFIVRNAQGDPLWQFISTYHDMTIGGAAPQDAPAVSPERVDHFLAGWANVTVQTSGQLPQWPQGAENIGSNGRLTYNTAFSRATYEATRQRNLRMICYAAAVDATQCLVVEPSSNAPAMIVAYGP